MQTTDGTWPIIRVSVRCDTYRLIQLLEYSTWLTVICFGTMHNIEGGLNFWVEGQVVFRAEMNQPLFFRYDVQVLLIQRIQYKTNQACCAIAIHSRFWRWRFVISRNHVGKEHLPYSLSFNNRENNIRRPLKKNHQCKRLSCKYQSNHMVEAIPQPQVKVKFH